MPAERYFTQAIKIDRNYADAYDNRGKSYLALRDYKKAIEDAKKRAIWAVAIYYNRWKKRARLAIKG
ncbi:hypothetical protein AGMMS49521_2400 [Campylobacterota bacterium]|nr:hypothetical protein AGMMS49521_2400 [Campylobacterota bacterium]